MDSSSTHSDVGGGAKVPSMETTDAFLLPLPPDTLARNPGLPLVVLVTKCDCMGSLEKEYDFKEEHFDFIQQHIRKFCLTYGAALVYTSVKEARNCDLLYKYLLHRVYGFPFTQPARVVEKDSVFIPAGWDNLKKIGILYENMNGLNPDDLYADHIKKPVLRRPQPKDAEVLADDEQVFLSRQQTLFASQAPPSKPQQPESPLLARSKTASASTVSAATAVTAKKPDGTKLPGQMSAPGQNNEGVLAQFFNNLLKTKAGPNGADQTTLNSSRSFDGSKLNESAAAELSRMLADAPRPAVQSDGESRQA